MGVRHCKTNSHFSTGKRWLEAYVDTLYGNRNIAVGISSEEVVIHRETIDRVQVGNLPAIGNQVGINRDGKIFSKTDLLFSESFILDGVPLIESDVVNLGIDLDNGIVNFFINGEYTHEVSIPTGIEYYVTIGVEPGCQVTVNLFQDTLFTYSPPTGYTDWDGNAIGVVNPPSNTLSTGVY